MPDPQQQAPSQAAPQTLAGMIRAKFPGSYNDLDDATLESNVLKKYPEYSDLPRSSKPTPQQSAQAAGPATGIGPQQGTVLPWLQNFEGDVRYGTTNTLPGKALHAMGATGVNVGSQAKAGDYAASPILGPTHVAQGMATLPKMPWEGAKQIAGGALEAAQIPASFMAPEATSTVAGKVAGAIPNTERAAGKLQQVMGAAKNNSVNISNELSSSLDRYQQLVDAGGGRSMAVSKLLNRVTNPDKGPLTYEEARDFYHNISRLSRDEFDRLTPVMKQQVGSIRAALNNAVQSAASAAGKGEEYVSGMKEYAKSAKLREFGNDVANYGWEQIKDKLPWLIGAAGVKKAYDVLK